MLAEIQDAPSNPTVAVSSVTFGFGTGINYGTNVSVPITTFDDVDQPEPASVFTMIGGLGLILFGARKYGKR